MNFHTLLTQEHGIEKLSNEIVIYTSFFKSRSTILEAHSTFEKMKTTWNELYYNLNQKGITKTLQINFNRTYQQLVTCSSNYASSVVL